MVTIKKKWVVIAAYATLAVGIVLFFVGWLKFYIGIPAALILAAGLVWLIRKDYWDDDYSISIPVVHLVLQVIAFSAVVALSGIAGVGVSGYDTDFRNAIFNDIMQRPWPVTYDDGSVMVYYCIFWMLPALVGKLFGTTAGYFALGVFAVWITTLAHLLIMTLLKIETAGKTWICAGFLLAWQGLHLLGAAVMLTTGHSLYQYGLLTDGSAYLDGFFNGEAFNWYYRSNFISLSESYNQIVIWLAVPLMLMKRTPRSYMCLGLMLLPYSPWGLLGIFPLLIVAAWPYMADLVRQKKLAQLAKDIFSPANLAVLVTVTPIFALYFMASSRTGGAASGHLITPDQVEEYIAAGLPYTTQTGSFGTLSFDRFSYRNLIELVFFWVIEFGIYAVLIAPRFKKKPLFWATLIMLAICPLLWFGTIDGRDFCMNGSLPALFVLMIATLDYVCAEVAGKKLGFRSLCLVMALTVALTGFSFGLLNRCQVLVSERSYAVIKNEIGSLGNLEYEKKTNFVILEPEGTLFFDYLAR